MIIPPSASPSWVKSELVKKQDKLTQGDGISISNNVVSVDLAEATQTSSGLMSAQDKKNLDTLKAGTISEYVKDAESTGVLLNLTKADGSVVSVRVTNVGQNTIDTDAAYPILLSGMKATNTATGTVAGANMTKAVTVNPMTGEVTAPIFKGSLDGTASKATADASGNVITSTYATKGEIPDTSGFATKAELEPFAKTADLDKYALDTDLSAYLPLNGGTMVGNLDMNSGVNIRFGTTNYFQGLTASGNRFDIFGLINSTRLVVGGTYPTLELRGKSGTRVTYNGENLALESDIPDVSGLATKAEIPDVSGFATKNEVSLLPTFEPKVVSALPTSNISNKVLYLVPADNGENDRYDQYIYVNNAWERIGSGMMTVDSAMSSTSTNPVQNKVIQSALAGKLSTTGTAARATADASGNDILSTYAKKVDLAGYLPLTGGTTSAEITVGGLGIITGGSEKTSYSGVQAVRRCTYDDDHVNTAGFIVNGDGSAKFMHRRGDVTADEDAFLRFDALGFRMVASGAKGVYAPYESISVFEALMDQNHPKFKDTDIALVSDLPTAGDNITIENGVISSNDSKVFQNSTTLDGSFPILIKTTANANGETGSVRFASGVTINPKTGHISAVAFDGPATKALADADGNAISSTYAKKAEIPDISGLATKSEIPDVSGFATKSEIPDTSGLATKSELSSYATVSALAGKLDTTGTAAKATADASGNVITTYYASKSYVDEAVGNIDVGALSGFLPLTGGTLTGDLTISKDDPLVGKVGNIFLGDHSISSGLGMLFLTDYDPEKNPEGVSIALDKTGLWGAAVASSAPISLGTSTYPWGEIYGTTIFQNGKQVATLEDLAGVSGGASGDYLPLTGGTLSGNLEWSDSSTWCIPYLLAFKNAAGNSVTYPYTGFYQWGPEWQVNARDASNTYVHNLLSINNETRVATFGARPTVNGAGLAMQSEVPRITISPDEPSGGQDGDIWLQYEE